MKGLEIKSKLSSAYHPQTDGQTERTNQTLEQYLRCFVNYQQTDWARFLPLAEFSFNNTIQASTGVSPFLLNYGIHPRMDFETPTIKGVKATDLPVQLRNLHSITAQLLRQAQERQARNANTRRMEPPFKVGDMVLVSTRNMKTNRPTKKLDYTRISPFKIKEIINKVSYRVDLPSKYKIHPVFHASLLELYHKDNSRKRTPPPPTPIIVDAQQEWIVEEILDSRIFYNKLQYLVKWKGYSQEEASWEPKDNVTNSPLLIKAFHEKYPARATEAS